MRFKDLDYVWIAAPSLGKGSQSLIDRKEKWDRTLWTALKKNKSDNGPKQVVLGNFNAVLDDKDIFDNPKFWMKQGEKKSKVEEVLEVGDQGFASTTANERVRLSEGMEEAGLRDAARRPGKTSPTQYTWRPLGRHAGKGMVTTYTMTSSEILDSGGVESTAVLEPNIPEAPFLGSQHRPRWFSLKPDWKEKVENFTLMDKFDVDPSERKKEARVNKIILNTMFSNNINSLTP
jgi:exonuclease III